MPANGHHTGKTTFSANTKRTNVFKLTLTKIQSSIAGMARSYRCSTQLGEVARRSAVPGAISVLAIAVELMQKIVSVK